VALRRAGIFRDARPHVGSRRVEPVGLAAAAGDDAIDLVAAAAAGAPARPIAARTPEAEKVAIGPHDQLLGGEVPIAIFLRFGIRLAAFFHGGFLSLSSAPAPAGEGDHPAQQGGGGGAGGDEILTTTGNHRCKIHSNVFQQANKKLIAVLVLQRQRLVTASAPSTTVRSLRELQWSPSPAIAVADDLARPRGAKRASAVATTKAKKSHQKFASK
jgi:hypothetical protein